MPGKMSDRSDQRKSCRWWQHQGPFAGAACQHRLTTDKRSVSIRAVDLGQAKAAPLQVLETNTPCQHATAFEDEYEDRGDSVRPDFFIWQSAGITVFLEDHREYELDPNPLCKASRWVVLCLFLLFLVGHKQLLSCG